MLRPSYPLYVANEAQTPNTQLEVLDKYSGKVATRVPLADAALIDQAIAAAHAARAPMAAMPSYARQAVLQHCVQRFEERAEELAQALCVEAGKPIKDSRGEVARLIQTFRLAAEEATRLRGETLPMDTTPRGHHYTAMTRLVPIGVCSFISPFNFPLNLAAHKIAPALAVGCPFVLKPASLTPVGALLIGEVLAETNLPRGAFSILPARRDGAELFTTDPRFNLLSFTGSPQVGWDLKARAGHKKVILELGGNAACIVDQDANVKDAVERILFGAFYQSGQSCIKAQRIIIHRAIYSQVRDLLVQRAAALPMGNPGREETFIGPMISVKEAERVMSWVQEARERGAKVLCGGTREGALVPATLLENVPRDAKVYASEVFGPVSVLSSCDSFDAALDEVNDSQFGLQAGVFTLNYYNVQKAWERLEVGGVIINDVPSFRADHMPYGGVKNSGLGREGVAYAMRDMTETRLLVVRTPEALRTR
jgi:acyl-CoA reductase-like NAD-dependent aldehyde dehydrogenase